MKVLHILLLLLLGAEVSATTVVVQKDKKTLPHTEPADCPPGPPWTTN